MTGTEPSYTPRPIRAVLRRSALAAAAIGAVIAVVLIVLGQPLWALFIAIGLALGVGNLRMVHRSAAVYAQRSGTGKKGFALGAIGRLALVSIIAFGCAALFRPEGVGAIAGLALFQFISVTVGAIPMMKEVRQW